MKIYHFMLVWLFLSISLSPQSLTATTPVLDKLLEMYQRQTTQPISPAELRQELARTGLDQLSPRELHEITRLFRHHLPEEEFTRQLARVLRTDFSGNLPTRTGQSFNGSNISTPDNRPLTGQEQSVLAAVLEDFQVNENAGGCDQEFPTIAMDDNGNFVVAWVDYRNGDYDIFAQRYSGNGTKLGANFRVNDDGGSQKQTEPSIAMDASGNFTVVWWDGRNVLNDYDIYAQRYTSSGTPSGANFRVNDDSGNKKQFSPSIAMDASGNFTVVWWDNRNGSNDYDIYAQRYTSSGTPTGANFRVNDDRGSSWQWFPSIAMDASGNFVVVWEDRRMGFKDYDIYAQRYTSSGTPTGANFRVNDDSGYRWQLGPSIAVDASGNFVVAWMDERNGTYDDIYAQRYSSSGTPTGANFRVNDDSGSSEKISPSIAVDASGNFVVAWRDERNGFYVYDIYAQRYTSSGTPSGANFRVNDDSGDNKQFSPSIAMDASGNFTVVWWDERNGDADIYAQRYTSSGTPSGANLRVNDDSGSSDQGSPSLAVDASGNFVVVWQDFRNVNWDIYAQRYTSSGTPTGANFQVNDDSGSSEQISPSIAVDASGNFVVVWEDRRNGNHDIYAQRYSNSGAKSGENFHVNHDSGSYGYSPSIAADASGNFVVVWEDRRNGDYDIYAQRYTSSGTPTGANFRVDDDSGGRAQGRPSIAVDASGNFVVAWQDERNGNYDDIYAQRYSSSGAKSGANFRVNHDSGSSWQDNPAIAVDASGNFVVVWRDYRNGNADIYAQRYTSSGMPSGLNFRVNHDSGSSWQDNPAIAVDASGNFVVVWEDRRNGNYDDIYAQKYNPSGKPIGTNYRVNNDTGDKRQSLPDVQLVNGHIYYCWEDNRVPGQGYDIFARVDNFQTAAVESNETTRNVPENPYLFQNYPNPFNATTTISYALPKTSHVSLQIFDLNGRFVRNLMQREQAAGIYTLRWDAKNDRGQQVTSGVYLCRLTTGNVVLQQKLTLVR